MHLSVSYLFYKNVFRFDLINKSNKIYLALSKEGVFKKANLSFNINDLIEEKNEKYLLSLIMLEKFTGQKSFVKFYSFFKKGFKIDINFSSMVNLRKNQIYKFFDLFFLYYKQYFVINSTFSNVYASNMFCICHDIALLPGLEIYGFIDWKYHMVITFEKNVKFDLYFFFYF